MSRPDRHRFGAAEDCQRQNPEIHAARSDQKMADAESALEPPAGYPSREPRCELINEGAAPQMTQSGPHVDPEARAMIGVVESRTSYPVSTRQIDEYLAAADDWNPLYHDEEAATAGPYGEVVAPPLFVLAASRPIRPLSRLLEDGQYDDLTIPGIHGRSVLASWEIDVHGLLRTGDVVTVREQITSIVEKIGKNGRLVIVSKKTEHVNQRGHGIATELQTIIYR
jgi:acyl dehydratase